MKHYTTNKRYCPHELQQNCILCKFIVKQGIFHTIDKTTCEKEGAKGYEEAQAENQPNPTISPGISARGYSPREVAPGLWYSWYVKTVTVGLSLSFSSTRIVLIRFP